MVGAMNRIRSTKIIKWTGQGIAAIAAVWFVIVLAIGLIRLITHPNEFFQFTLENISFIISELAGLTGLLLTWKRDLISCLLLLISSMGLGINIFIYHKESFVWMVIGFPYLIGGVLIFISWRLLRRNQKQIRKASPSYE